MLTRRSLILGASAVCAVPYQAAAATPPRVLRFNNLHTGERLVAEYWTGDGYDAGALSAIDHVLRDFRTDETHAMDPRLLDLLHALSRRVGTQAPFRVISGFRSPTTNAMLRSESSGVAAHSLHMEGMAIDIALEDVGLADLRQAALDLQGGGVGYYPASGFVHVDVGRVRRW
jgi:uncharacterized protein YcbK (DUF882 family)